MPQTADPRRDGELGRIPNVDNRPTPSSRIESSEKGDGMGVLTNFVVGAQQSAIPHGA